MLLREFFVDTLQVECLVVELRLGHLLLLECQGVKCRLLLQPLKHLWLALQYSGMANRGAASLSRFFLWDNLHFDVQGRCQTPTKKVWLSGLTRLPTSPKKSLKSCLFIPPIPVILLPLRPASLTHRNPKRRKIIYGMRPSGRTNANVP